MDSLDLRLLRCTTPANTRTKEGTVTDSAALGAALPQVGYARVNGLQMYYEIHGSDREDLASAPVLFLHGAYMSTGAFWPLLPALAATRRVIVCDLQAHG
jgi:hypothetical protein